MGVLASSKAPNGEPKLTLSGTAPPGDKTLVFECESDGTLVSIDHVSHEPKDAEHLEESFYSVRDSGLQQYLGSSLHEGQAGGFKEGVWSGSTTSRAVGGQPCGRVKWNIYM